MRVWALTMAARERGATAVCRHACRAVVFSAVLIATPIAGRAAASVPAPARRVVCLSESALATLYMLGAERTLVGIPASVRAGEASRFFASLDTRIESGVLPSPERADGVEVDAVLKLRPELVVLGGERTRDLDVLREAGVRTYGIGPTGVEDIYREVRELGRLTGTVKRAAELVRYARREATRITVAARRPGEPLAAVYFMWPGSPFDTTGAVGLIDELFERAGARNLCRTPRERVTVDLEDVLVWNPDVILMAPDKERSAIRLAAQPRWRDLTAAREGRIHEFPAEFNRTIHTLEYVHVLRRMAAWCHPSAFRDVSLPNEKRFLLDALYGARAPNEAVENGYR